MEHLNGLKNVDNYDEYSYEIFAKIEMHNSYKKSPHGMNPL